MHNVIEKFRKHTRSATNSTIRYVRYPAFGLQWTSRYVLIWIILAFGLIGVPSMYSAGAIDIETVNQLGRYLCFALLALSLDLVWGHGGMLCLCQALFFALGGYAMGMYLAHHGGPEGIIDANNWGKIPACLFVVYPGEVGQTQHEWTVPFFWKPFWNLWSTVILGLFIPGAAAGLIGYSVFRSGVRGVFFAVVTQAIVLASWNVFCMNEMKAGGTNGLTRFDRIVLASREGIDIKIRPQTMRDAGLSVDDIRRTLVSAQADIDRAYHQQVEARQQVVARSTFVSGDVIVDPVVTELEQAACVFTLSLGRSVHVWETRDRLRLTPVITRSGDEILLNEVAEVEIAGFRLTDARVKLALYLLTVLLLIAVYSLCRCLMSSKFGRVLIAIRDNESRLRFAGYEPYVYKTFIFAVSGMIAGLAGMLYAPQMRIFTPTNLEPKESILIVVWVAVGGRGTLAGPIIGALGVNYLYSVLTSHAPEAWPFVLGALFVAVTRFLPNGLMDIWSRWLALPLRPLPAGGEHGAPRIDDQLLAPHSRLATGFGLASAVVAAWIAYALFTSGSPLGDGLMAKRSETDFVAGMLFVLAAACAAMWGAGSLEMLCGRQGRFDFTKAAMKALLGLCVAVVLWCFVSHSFSSGANATARFQRWIFAGGMGLATLVRGNPSFVAAGLCPLVGLGFCWWLEGGRWSRVRAIVRAWADQFRQTTDIARVTSVTKFADAFVESRGLTDDSANASNSKTIERTNGRANVVAERVINPATTNGHLLCVRGVQVLFGGFKALDVDNFSIRHNELHVIIGPNGAGKTTLCDVISGKTCASQGQIWLDGRDITNMPEVEVARLGVGRKFQTPTVFDSLTVEQNMELALPDHQRLLRSFTQQPTSSEQKQILQRLKRVGLHHERTTPVGHLSHGQRQWLEISMLFLSGPRLLLIDEPAAGLTDDETALTAELLLELQETHGVIVIEHDMDFVRMLDAPITVLHEGAIMRQGTMDEIEQDADVREAYLGR